MNGALVFAVLGMLLVGGTVYYVVDQRSAQPPGITVMRADLSHKHLRATMVAEWQSRSEPDRITTDFVDSSFTLATRTGCGLEDGPWSKCRNLLPHRGTLSQNPACTEPYQNRCFAGLASMVIETMPGFVDDPQAGQERPSRTIYVLAHYCCTPETPWAMLAPDGTAKVTSEYEFIPLYGDFIITFYPYHTEWKRTPWGETYTWGGSGDPIIHTIRVQPLET